MLSDESLDDYLKKVSKETSTELTLEQQFKLQNAKNIVHRLTLEQAQFYAVEITKQMMIKENLVRHLLRSHPPSN